MSIIDENLKKVADAVKWDKERRLNEAIQADLKSKLSFFDAREKVIEGVIQKNELQPEIIKNNRTRATVLIGKILKTMQRSDGHANIGTLARITGINPVVLADFMEKVNAVTYANGETVPLWSMAAADIYSMSFGGEITSRPGEGDLYTLQIPENLVIPNATDKPITGLEDYYNEDGKIVPKRVADDIIVRYKFKTTRDNDTLYIYREGCYYETGECVVSEEARKLLGEETTSHIIKEIVLHVKISTYIDRKTDNGTSIINLKTGVYDITAKKLRPHDPEEFLTYQVPVDFNPSAECPAFKKFLSEVAEPQDIPTIQEMVGYCLYRAYPIHKAFMFHGDGENGKSTLLAAIKAFLGENNISNISLQAISSDKNRFALASLYGKLANIYPDLTTASISESGVFKALVTGDTLSAEVKFKNYFPLTNYAKFIFSCNTIPYVKDDSHAFFRRWVIFSFNNTFTNETRDANILSKIITPEELSGILNWALEGLYRLLENGHMTDNKTSDDIRKKYKILSNPVSAFVDEFVEANLDGSVEKEILYAQFLAFCKNRGLVPVSDEIFCKNLRYEIPGIKSERVREAGRRIHIFRGIELIGDMAAENAPKQEIGLNSFIPDEDNELTENPDLESGET